MNKKNIPLRSINRIDGWEERYAERFGIPNTDSVQDFYAVKDFITELLNVQRVEFIQEIDHIIELLETINDRTYAKKVRST